MGCSECQSAGSEVHISAVILDLDGTILDTERATKDVLKEFLARYGRVLDREKEDGRLGQSHKESAASIVQDYDLPLTPDQFSEEIMPMYKEKWPLARALPGVNRLMKHLCKHKVPFGLASNSTRKLIEGKISLQQGWKESFSVILGSDEVNSPKPSPDLYLEAAKRMDVDPGSCLVIEDSMVGVKAAKAAKMKVVAVPSILAPAEFYSLADSVLHSLLEFRPELWGLQPFDDWVENALPIEPMYVKGMVSNGVLCEATDDVPSVLPDQFLGVYFGWGKLSSHGIIKVVVNVGWDPSCCPVKKVIKPYLTDGIDDYINNQQLQLFLVGYIHGLSKVNKTMDIENLEEHKSIASVSLDLPDFTHYSNCPLFAEAA